MKITIGVLHNARFKPLKAIMSSVTQAGSIILFHWVVFSGMKNELFFNIIRGQLDWPFFRPMKYYKSSLEYYIPSNLISVLSIYWLRLFVRLFAYSMNVLLTASGYRDLWLFSHN